MTRLAIFAAGVLTGIALLYRRPRREPYPEGVPDGYWRTATGYDGLPRAIVAMGMSRDDDDWATDSRTQGLVS